MSQTLLTSLEFGKKINESAAKSSTGNDFLSKYRGYVMNNPVSCSVVNRFLQESQNLAFDEGVQDIRNTISNFINENKYSWMLASTCDRIEESQSSFDILSKHACKQVRNLLEMSENDIVNYIKAGALKNVQYVSEFRQIAQQVYKDKMPIVEALDYKVSSPISFVESKDGNLYFCVLDRVFACDEKRNIHEVKAKDMSQKFAFMNSILKEFQMETLGDNVKFSIMDNKETIYAVENKNLILRKTKDCKNDGEVMTTEEFRQWYNTYTKGVMPQKAAQYSNFFENICKIAENFEDICYIDNVKVISTGKSNVSLIEGFENYIVTVHNSIQNRIFSENYKSLVEALDIIKSNTHVDLRSLYKDKINEELNTKAIQEQKEVQKEMELEEIKARKQIVENLANKFKTDPLKLAIVNNIAKDLAQLEENLNEENLNETKLWYLGWRGNPQLKNGGYYKAYEQLTKKEAKEKEKTLYGSMLLKSFDTEKEYKDAIKKAYDSGYSVTENCHDMSDSDILKEMEVTEQDLKKEFEESGKEMDEWIKEKSKACGLSEKFLKECIK